MFKKILPSDSWLTVLVFSGKCPSSGSVCCTIAVMSLAGCSMDSKYCSDVTWFCCDAEPAKME